MTDRVDEVVEFALPDATERLAMLNKYFKSYVREATKGSVRIADDVDDALFASLAGEKMVGFSGRSISKLCSAFQAAGFSSSNGVIDRALVMEVFADHEAQNRLKQTWVATKLQQ